MLKTYKVSYEDIATQKKVSKNILAETNEEAKVIAQIIAPTDIFEFGLNLVKTGLSLMMSPKLAISDFVIFADSLYEATEDMGLPISEALIVMAQASREENTTVANLCDNLISFLTLGNSLGESVKMTSMFPDMFVELLPVAESVGKTGYILKKMALYYADMDAFNKSVKSSLMMPKIQLGFAGGAFLFLTMQFIPNLMSNLGEKAVRPNLKGVAKTMVGVSDVLLANFNTIVALIIGFFLVLKIGKNFIKIPDSVTVFLTRVPLVGRVIKLNAYIYMFSALEVMLANSVPEDEALTKVSKSMSNPFFRIGLREAVDKMHLGITMPEAIRGLIDPYAYQVLHIAAQAGQTDVRCAKLTSKYSEELTAKLKTMLAILNPIVMLAIALIVVLLFLTLFGMQSAMRGSMG